MLLFHLVGTDCLLLFLDVVVSGEHALTSNCFYLLHAFLPLDSATSLLHIFVRYDAEGQLISAIYGTRDLSFFLEIFC